MTALSLKFSLFSLLIFNFSSISQTRLPDNFKIGDYVEIFGTDSIKIYFNCAGAIVDKKCASHYRVGKMDTTIINVMGNFNDYDINGRLYLKATMFNNNLEGVASYYYKSGGVSEEGAYLNNIRQGKWTFYYPNGKIRKIYDYLNGEPRVLEAYTSKGKATVTNGNGYFKTEFSVYPQQCSKYEASGKISNGRKDGKWVFLNPITSFPIATEIYENGSFIKGVSSGYELLTSDNKEYSEYTKNPKILLASFYASEGLKLLSNMLICEKQFFSWQYNDADLLSTFYPELQKQLIQYDFVLKNQWVVVGIKVNEKSKLSEINVASSINDVNFENYIHSILSKMTNWKAAIINSKETESDIFFPILVDNDQIIIPEYYLSRNK